MTPARVRHTYRVAYNYPHLSHPLYAPHPRLVTWRNLAPLAARVSFFCQEKWLIFYYATVSVTSKVISKFSYHLELSFLKSEGYVYVHNTYSYSSCGKCTVTILVPYVLHNSFYHSMCNCDPWKHIYTCRV